MEDTYEETLTIKGLKGDKGDQGPQGIQGVPGKDGRDGMNGSDGRDGLDGKDGRDGADGSPDTPEEIARKLNTLDGEVDIKVIRGMDSYVDKTTFDKSFSDVKGKIDMRWHGAGLSKVYTDSTLTGTGTQSNPLHVESGGGGNPGGSNMDIQFNDGGDFGGDPNFIFDKSSARVGIRTTSPAYQLDVTGTISSNYDPTSDFPEPRLLLNSLDLSLGLVSEVNGQLIDYGSNFSQLGPMNPAFPGGFFRIDLRDSYTSEFFNIKYVPVGEGEHTVYRMSSEGVMQNASRAVVNNGPAEAQTYSDDGVTAIQVNGNGYFAGFLGVGVPAGSTGEHVRVGASEGTHYLVLDGGNGGTGDNPYLSTDAAEGIIAFGDGASNTVVAQFLNTSGIPNAQIDGTDGNAYTFFAANGGNVGIATNAPHDRLVVHGGIHATGTASAEIDGDHFMDFIGNVGRRIITGNDASTYPDLDVELHSDSAETLPQQIPIYIRGAGYTDGFPHINLGNYDPNPTAAVTINDYGLSSNDCSFAIFDNDGGAFAMQVKSSTLRAIGFGGDIQSGTSHILVNYDDPSIQIIDIASGSLNAQISGDAVTPANTFFAALAGKVGIGTASPAVKLQVKSGAISGDMDTMAYASAISLDTTKGNTHKTTTVNATGNATINASSAGIAGQHITIIVSNDATSGKVITFGSNFRSSGTLTGTPSKTAVVKFESDGSAWFEASRTSGL